MKKNIIVALLFCFFFTACEKKPVPTEVGAPPEEMGAAPNNGDISNAKPEGSDTEQKPAKPDEDEAKNKDKK